MTANESKSFLPKDRVLFTSWSKPKIVGKCRDGIKRINIIFIKLNTFSKSVNSSKS